MALFLFCQYMNNLRGMCNRSIKKNVRCPQNVHSVQYSVLTHCTVFRKAYILSGSGFHEFLYSIIESLRKIREIAEFIPDQLCFHEKKL